MGWESDQETAPPERNLGRLVWVVIAGIFVAMIVTMWGVESDTAPLKSRAFLKEILIAQSGNSVGDRDAAFQIAQDVHRRVVSGENFAKLAREYSSDHKSARRGGDIGWVYKGDISSEVIQQFVWEGPLNTVSEIIQTNHGFHIVIVAEREISDFDRFEQELSDRALGRTPEAESDADSESEPEE